MKASLLAKTLEKTIPAHEPVLIKGAPGVGKTDITHQICGLVDADLVVEHPVVSDPTDYKGLPFAMPGTDSATFLPFGELKRLIEADRLTVCFIDDLGQAPAAVQAACFPPTAKVRTETGVKNIVEITKGEKVLTDKGSFKTVTETF